MPIRKIDYQEDQSFKVDVESSQSAACNYSVIGFEVRMRLIQMVCVEKQQIIKAAAQLGIKLSTAKYILKCFRKDGKILRKNDGHFLENSMLSDQLQALKLKVEQLNRQKMERKQKQRRNRLNKGSAQLNYQKQEGRLEIPKLETHFTNYAEEPKIIQSLQASSSLSNPSNQTAQPYFFLMFYNPLWFNSGPKQNFIQ